MPSKSTQKRKLKIEFDSEKFPAASGVTNGPAVLETSWDELIWAAVTVGRPNRQYVFRHGEASMYEALFRLSLIRMALHQRAGGYRLRRTEAAKTLDPSEKGAVSYFLGMAIAKLFSARLLRAPWLLHLDVFRPQLDVDLKGRSRPDLIGQTNTGKWVALESKGRLSQPNALAKQKAKEQAKRVRISGKAPSYQVGAITYFRSEALKFFWRDPESEKEVREILVKFEDVDWRYYYEPVFDLVTSRLRFEQNNIGRSSGVAIREADVELEIHPIIFRMLSERNWAGAKQVSIEHADEFQEEGYQLDGIRLTAGRSWFVPFQEFES
jgi:hypothetical protein